MIQARVLSPRDQGGQEEVKDVRLVSIDEYQKEKQKISTNSWALLMFIGYLILGIFVYSLDGKISPLDSIYLSVITFSTVGYGDVPITNRVFQSFYCILGAGIVGIYFGLLTSDIMDTQEEMMKNRLVKVAVGINKYAEAKAQRLRDYQMNQHRQLLDRIKNTDPEKLTAWDKMQFSISKVFVETEEAAALRNMKKINMQIYEEELREVRSKGLVDFFYLVISIFSGAAFMCAIEGWTFQDAFYWACVTATTIGYGDVTPTSATGKVFTIIYVIFATALAAKGFRDLVCYPMLVRQKESEAYVLSQFTENLSEKTLERIVNNQLFKEVDKLQYNQEMITKSEFILLVLCNMRKVNMKDILLASKCFDFLDARKEGFLSKETQEEALLKARQRDFDRQLELEKIENEKKALEDAAGLNVVQSIRRMTIIGGDGGRTRGDSTVSDGTTPPPRQREGSILLSGLKILKGIGEGVGGVVGIGGSGTVDELGEETVSILHERETDVEEKGDEEIGEGRARRKLVYNSPGSDAIASGSGSGSGEEIEGQEGSERRRRSGVLGWLERRTSKLSVVEEAGNGVDDEDDEDEEDVGETTRLSTASRRVSFNDVDEMPKDIY